MTREVQTSPNIGIRIGQAIPIHVRRSSVAIGRIVRIAADVRNGIRRSTLELGSIWPILPCGLDCDEKGFRRTSCSVFQRCFLSFFSTPYVGSGRGRPSRIEHKGQTSPNSGTRTGQAIPTHARRPSAAIGRIGRIAADVRNGSRSGRQVLIIAETCG